ncbi:chaplin [Streptomyces broussonetiae]|uniref:DUF320 domain-containing protein n=1 Tax=Streptomyces broussonetiae TaxID=2686304 RepID=A0A6I6N1T5_9ACTN|nr:chaplin [Streptomyces broussonetiae]QHA05492.1 DUF320 domain-containing protein [Streptomyces broussonetiae]
MIVMKKMLAVAAAACAVVLGGAGLAAADAGAQGAADKSPGVISGNVVQAPIHVPVELCGDTVDGIAALNPAFGTTCVDG